MLKIQKLLKKLISFTESKSQAYNNFKSFADVTAWFCNFVNFVFVPVISKMGLNAKYLKFVFSN